MFDFGLRSIIDNRADDFRVLVIVPGSEGNSLNLPPWGIGITNTQIRKLLEQVNADYSDFQVKTLAAWSAGWKGMVGTMRAVGKVNDLVDLTNLEQVIFYDCLYFTEGSKGLVDDALTKVQKEIAKQSRRVVQVIAYLVTPGGNDSLKPKEILGGIPFLRINSLEQGLITISDAARTTLRKICILRSIAWAIEDGAISQNDVSPVIGLALPIFDHTKRQTVRSLPTLPYGKNAPSGTVDLRTFAANSDNAAIVNINVNGREFLQAMDLVQEGKMIFSGTYPRNEVDHMIILPELGWEFLAG